MRRACPDFGTLFEFLKTNHVPLVGISVTPSFRTEGKQLPKKPRIGFVKHEVVRDAAKKHGIPDGFLPKKRVPADAFRRAVNACASDREFKERGFMMKQWTKRDGWDEPDPCYVVLDKKSADVDRQHYEQHTVQFVQFKLDTNEIETRVFHQSGYIVVAPVGHLPLIQPGVTDYYLKFGTCCTTEDISHMVSRLIKEFCGGVPLRKGGGQYFVPRDDSPSSINSELDIVQAFVSEVRAGGEVGCVWTPFPLLDYQEIREDLRTHVQAHVGQQLQTRQDEIAAMVLKIKVEGQEAVRTGTRNKRLKELGDLERQASLLLRVIGAENEADSQRLMKAIEFSKQSVEAMLTGQQLPSPEMLDDDLDLDFGFAPEEELLTV